MDDTSASLHRSLDDSTDDDFPANPRHLKNIVSLVVTPKKTKRAISHSNPNYPLSQVNLIQLTEQLAADAKSGKLKGLGGFTEYDDGYYTFGLEGSYLSDPGSAVLPLARLQDRIMTQIKEED